MTLSRLSYAVVAMAALVAVVGCNSGDRNGKPSYGPGSTGSGGGGGSGNAAVTVTAGQNQQTALLGTTINALVLTFQNSGSTAANITGLTVTASGTVDESQVVTTAAVVDDQNANGVVDTGEPQLATAASPAFSANDGTVTFTFSTPLTVPASGSAQVIVTVSTIARTGTVNQIPFVGQTVVLSIASAADIAGATVGATYPVTGNPCSLGIGTHLLISEVFYNPGGQAEFIEIFNPTGETIQLANYHLTDYTDSATPPTRFYYLLTRFTTNGLLGEFGPVNPTAPNEADFSVRFPSNASIAPGAFQVIAVDGGPTGFTTQFSNVTPTYALRNATPPTVSMLVWEPTVGSFIAGNVGPMVTLTNDGEAVFLFTWDGQANPPSDLVTDVDIVAWGDPSGSTNYLIDKGGVPVDGIDQGTQTTSYRPETPLANQDANRLAKAALGQSMVRINYAEGNEVAANGNGVGGHDETSEVWSQTFTNGTPTPGGP